MGNFNPDKLIYSEALQVTMFDKSNGAMLWVLEDVKDPNLSFTMNTEDKVDARGDVIKKFYSAKAVKLTGSTSFFTLSLVAAQLGTEKTVASATNKIIAPAREKILVKAENIGESKTPLTLSHKAAGATGSEIAYIYLFDGKTQINSYAVSTTADETHFALGTTDDKTTITLPTDTNIKEGMRIWVWYLYETEEAVAVEGTFDDYPKEGECWVEALFTDVCDKNIEYHGWIVISSAQLSPESEVALNKTGDYSFTIDSTKDYCNEDGLLIRYVIPKD